MKNSTDRFSPADLSRQLETVYGRLHRHLGGYRQAMEHAIALTSGLDAGRDLVLQRHLSSVRYHMTIASEMIKATIDANDGTHKEGKS